MLGFVLRRTLAVLPVLLAVAVLVFLMLRLVPGDPAAVIAGDSATPEQVAALRARLGLERPIPAQFAIWLGHVLQGDLGESYFFRKPVTELIAQRLEPTLALGVAALTIAVAVAVPLGVLAAFRQGTWIDRTVMGLSVAGFSMPVFVLGYLLVYVFSIRLEWLPVQGYARLSEGLLPFLERLVLPAVTLSVVYVALVARITRTSVLDVLNEDYVRTARAKGLTEREVLVRHALRNAAVPILTIIGIGLAVLIGGAVVTESVFAIPGLGRLTVEAVLSRDFPVIQALILLFATGYVFVNLAIDIGYAMLDPRIRY
ncbi:MAG: ABC transporter permease [Burkholderiaceae bacterium]|jgi:peptide/nickel transport system permease protein|nr:ABC transporter permease [Burkholderiales bacterium]MCZ8101457.1 ABC transporter permease [Burkholderiales bacterium]MCZ8338396.1 ABC transporter permease [Burkholderiaceae bacterium]